MVGSGRNSLHLCTCKNEGDPIIKAKGASVATIINIDFSDTQWQQTRWPVVGSGRNSLPPRTKAIK